MKRVVSIIVILVGVLFLYKIFSLPKNINVTIGDDGFSSQNITIKKGDTVTWISAGQKLHWPASDAHPTHSIYPEKGGCIGSKLDACRGLSSGEKFTFKFEDPGSWVMHDHLFPNFTMIVKVVGDNNSTNNNYVSENEIYAKDIEYVKNLAEKDPSVAWQYIKDKFIVNGQVMGNAHEFAHIVGNKAYEKFGFDGIKICDDAFAFGCFHGVTEEMLLKEGVGKVKMIEEKCLSIFPPEKSQSYTGCIHGTGHGIYGFEGGNLKKSLNDCDVISERNRQYCYDGVFMENSSSPSGSLFDKNNPWKLCSDLDEKYHRNCARYQSQVFLKIRGTNESSVFSTGKYCELAPTTLLRNTCYESLGYYVAQQSLGNLDKILQSCGSIESKEGSEICKLGSAIETVFQKYENSSKTSEKLCQSLSSGLSSRCIENINNLKK